MKNKMFKRIAALFALVLCTSLICGCGEKDLEKISKGLSVYTITADFDEETHSITASQRVQYVNNYDVELSCVDFHLYPAAYREGARFSPIEPSAQTAAYPTGKNYGGIKINSVKVGGVEKEISVGGSDSDILCVPLNDALLPGAKAEIDIDFEVSLACIRHRLGYYGKTVNLGNFYPIACIWENGAYRNDPYYACGDPFYSDVANYNVTVTYPEKYIAAHTGEGSETAENSVKTLTASAKAVRDFAVVLGEFECEQTTVGGVSVKYFHYADADAASSLKAAADALKTFNEMFGDYPYSTYSVAQTAFLQGGMEYPNLSFVSDALSRSVYIDAIIHETAHQWWYGVVGNDEINSSWLDEGLTEYVTSLFYKHNEDYGVEFDKRIADALSSYILYSEIYKEGDDKDTSMNRSLAEYSGSMEYTYMTYVKGSLMLDNLRRIIGDDAFLAALKMYYKDNYLKIATVDCLIACFEKASSRDLKGYFDSWVNGNVLLYSK